MTQADDQYKTLMRDAVESKSYRCENSASEFLGDGSIREGSDWDSDCWDRVSDIVIFF